MTGVVFHDLTFPAGIETDQLVGWMRTLATRHRAGMWQPHRPVIFEFHATTTQRVWRIGIRRAEATELVGRVEHWFPGIAITPTTTPTPTISGRAVELRLRSQRRPLRAELQPEITRALLDAVADLKPGEEVRVRWVVGGWLNRRPVPPTSKHMAPRMRDLWSPPPTLDSEATTESRKKQSEHVFACVGRIAVTAATIGRERQLLSRVTGAFQLLRVAGAGLVRRRLPSWIVADRMDRHVVNRFDPACVLRADELAAVLGWPVGLDSDIRLPGVDLNRSRLLRPHPRVLRPATATRQRVIAESAYPSSPGNLVLPTKQALRHLHVIGPTGVGKSTLLTHMAVADISNGYGTIVVDPKGDLVDDILERLPDNRLDDVAVLDPTDAAPLGLNPLARRDGNDSGVAVDGLLGVLHSLWSDSWGPRLGDVLHAGLLTLAAEPGYTLVELPLLLTNPAFRRPLAAAASARDPLGLAGFWAWFDQLSAEQSAQVLAPVMNKLRAFILRPDLRAVLGQPEPRFDLTDVFRRRKSLLVRLPKGEVGSEAAALLGSLVVHQVWHTALTRTAIPAARRRPVFVYLDEFQEFVRLPLALADALAQARGLGVGLVLAHQHLDQLDRDIRTAVLANAGSRIAFRLDHTDAAVMAKRSGGSLTAEDFTRLPAFGAYADLVADDLPRGFASAQTRPPQPPLRTADAAKVASRARYGTPRNETEQRLRGLVDGVTAQSSGSAGGVEAGGFGVVPNGDGS